MHSVALSERVGAIVATVLGDSRAGTEAEWDSLQQIEVVLAIEDELGVTIAEADIPRLRSSKALVAYLEEALRAPR